MFRHCAFKRCCEVKFVMSKIDNTKPSSHSVTELAKSQSEEMLIIINETDIKDCVLARAPERNMREGM